MEEKKEQRRKKERIRRNASDDREVGRSGKGSCTRLCERHVSISRVNE